MVKLTLKEKFAFRFIFNERRVYYPDAEHCTVDYLDEVFPYIVDWLQRHLRAPGRKR